MIISLLGYMGSGKSHISKVLSQKLNLPVIDLDDEILLSNHMPIAEIFDKKGEIFFRREEKRILTELLALEKDFILSLGGGTPAYYDNIELINKKSTSVYLRSNIGTLTARLKKQKAKRPLLAKIPDDDLPEFIAKHLFERQPFYAAAKFTVTTDGKKPSEVAEQIADLL